jgi:glycosyltransferase involved in cell wall biosynthesis
MKPLRVLFAPDWRAGVPYQRLLAEALGAHGIEVGFLRDYRRLLPLTRLLRPRQRAGHCDLLHLHWPEAYYPDRGDGLDPFRCARFSLDLALATRRSCLVVTAHNLLAHDRGGEAFAAHNSRFAFRRAAVVFAHSAAAADALVATCGVKRENVCVIPHGDLSVAMPPPLAHSAARARLGLGDEKVCLIFGAIEPYKGLEEVLAHWRRTSPPARLVIVGKPSAAAYGAAICAAAEGIDKVTLHLERASDEELAVWLSAADCALFNYRTIFTSGAASLARSWGLPILLPARLTTVDLLEPSPLVHRFVSFEADFAGALDRALALAPDFASAADWRESTGWAGIARHTAEAYRRVLRPDERALIAP